MIYQLFDGPQYSQMTQWLANIIYLSARRVWIGDQSPNMPHSVWLKPDPVKVLVWKWLQAGWSRTNSVCFGEHHKRAPLPGKVGPLHKWSVHEHRSSAAFCYISFDTIYGYLLGKLREMSLADIYEMTTYRSKFTFTRSCQLNVASDAPMCLVVSFSNYYFQKLTVTMP